jgi:translation initiation factor IF-1
MFRFLMAGIFMPVSGKDKSTGKKTWRRLAAAVETLIGRGNRMTKEEMLEFDGAVVEVLPDGRVRVQMDNGHAIIAYTAGRMKRNRIRMTAGDRVTVEMTPYDLNKGRVVFRHKTGPAVRSGQPQRGPHQRRR